MMEKDFTWNLGLTFSENEKLAWLKIKIKRNWYANSK